MSQSKRDLQLSEGEIRAIYAEGAGAVVSLVTELLERLNRLEAEVKDLKGRLSKDSRNSSKPPSGDGFGKRTRSLRRPSDQSSGGQVGHPGQTLEWRHEPDGVERRAMLISGVWREKKEGRILLDKAKHQTRNTP